MYGKKENFFSFSFKLLQAVN